MLNSKKIITIQMPSQMLLQSKNITVFVWIMLIPLAIILSYTILHSIMLLGAVIVCIASAILFFRPLWGLYLLIALIPFQIFPMAFFSSLVEVGSIAQLLVKFLFVVTIFRIIQSHRFSFAYSPLNIWIVLFILISLCSIVNTSALIEHIKDTIPKVIDLFLLYFIISCLVDTKKKLQIVVNTFLMISMLVVSFGMLQMFGQVETLERYLKSDIVSLFVGPLYAEVRTGGMLAEIGKDRFNDVVSLFVNHSDYGGFLLYSFPLALGLFLMEKSPKSRLFYGALTFLFGISILLSLARSAWLGLFAVLVFTGIVTFRHKIRWVVLSLCAIICIVSCCWFMEVSYLSFLPSSMLDRFQSTVLQGEHSNSFRIRLGWWLDSIEIISRSPLTRLLGSTILFKTHNLYVQTLLLFGLLGLTTLLIIIILAIYKLYKGFRSSNDSYIQGVSLGACASFIGLSFHSLFWNDLFFVPSNDMLFALFLGLATILPTIIRYQNQPINEKVMDVIQVNSEVLQKQNFVNHHNPSRFMNTALILSLLCIATVISSLIVFFEFSPFDVFSYTSLMVIMFFVLLEIGKKGNHLGICSTNQNSIK